MGTVLGGIAETLQIPVPPKTHGKHLAVTTHRKEKLTASWLH